MANTLVQWLGDVVPERLKYWLYLILGPIYDRYSTQVLSSAGLAISAAGSTLVKAGSLSYSFVKGNLASIAAGTNMPALVGTVTHGTFNVFAFFLDGAGVLTSQMGTAGATLGAVIFPPIPSAKACLGFVIINPTGTGDFVGGTTALDNVTVVPNAVYLSPTAPFNPAVIVE